MYNLPDHPTIRNMELTGTPDGKPETYPECPICGHECETIYKDKDGDIVGCDECITNKDAWECEDCFSEKSGNYIPNNICTPHNPTPKSDTALTYLAGPISSDPHFLGHFAAAQIYLSKLGYHIVNPAAITNVMPKEHMSYNNFMDLGLTLLSMCGIIVFLPGWEDSVGAKMEYAYAKAHNIKILYYNDIYKS